MQCFIFVSLYQEQLNHLEAPGFGGQPAVDGHHQHHDQQTGQDRGTQLDPEEGDGQNDLQRTRPQQMDEVGDVVKSLGVR